MSLQCTITEGEAWFSGEQGSISVRPVALKAVAADSYSQG
jgi:hypothetical protein